MPYKPLQFMILLCICAWTCAALPRPDMLIHGSGMTREVDDVQRQRFQQLSQELRCLVCQNQDLLDSHAPLAVDLKMRIVSLMKQGKTDAQIKAYLVARYGEFILFKPPLKLSTWGLWFGPFILLLAGLLGLLYWARRAGHDV